MGETTQGGGLDEFASEIDAPRSDELADFEPELSADAPEAVVAVSRASEDPGRQHSRQEPGHLPRRAQPSLSDENNNTLGPANLRYGASSLVVAACVGVVTVAGLAGYLLQRTPARAVQLPSVAIERGRMPSVPSRDAQGNAVPGDPLAQGDGRSSTIVSDETNHEAATSRVSAPPARQPGNRESEIARPQPRGGSPGRTTPPTASLGMASGDDRTVATTQQAEPAHRDTTDDGPGENVTGWWTLTNEVQATSYERYRGLRLVYRLRLQQNGNRVTGTGQKWVENGRPIPRVSRIPIEVSGTIEGRRLMLKFTEQGFRRVSRGAFQLDVMDDGRLGGTFQSDVAQSQGSSVAQRGA